ncbi:MAG: 4'-phosphopantetheinyl transferase superfamily protein [Chloracidobacterium sp.]|nr:4'-phosphopantetheinyl transferase superfamily protein [Chloracidobacterium sp.]
MNIPKIEWAMASQPPDMSGKDVHVWRVDLCDPADVQPRLNELLSPDELKRASRYHFDKDRSSYKIRRAVLKMILGSYVREKAEDLQFTYNNFDKPKLKAKLPIRFNASSSNCVGIIAIALDTRIGIDIEFVDDTFPTLELAEKYFSADEVRALGNLQPELQTAAFFDCWTKKEAYVKAVGDGMSHPLPELVISSDEQGQFSVDAISGKAADWCFTSFIPQQNYIASLAYEGERRAESYFSWQMS